MATALLQNNNLTFNDGSSDLIKFTASSNVCSFQGSGSGVDIRLTGISNPTKADDAANKSYVDAQISSQVDSKLQGISWKEPCQVASTANFGATYDSSQLTLTAAANGAFSMDGVSPSVNARVLIKNQTTDSQNGIYVLSIVGDESNPAVLTRSDDCNSDAEFNNATVFVTQGSTNADKGYTQNTDNFTLDSSSASFVQFSKLSDFTGGDGININGSEISCDPDNTTLEIVSKKVSVKNGGIGSSQLAADCVNASKVADGAIEVDHIKNGSIVTAKVQDGAITAAKLNSDAAYTAGNGLLLNGREFYIGANGINASMLGSNTVTATAIAEGAVGASEIANGSVGSDELAADSVTNAKLSDSCVNTAELTDGCVTSDKLANNSVLNAHLSDAIVGTAELADSCVNSSKLADGSVNSDKIATLTTLNATGIITAGSFSATSDKRLKENIEDLNDCLKKVCEMKPKKYNFKK